MDTLHVDAVYEHGTLKLAEDVPLQEGQKVRVTIHSNGATAWRSRIGFEWKGTVEEFDQHLSDDNHSWVSDE